MDAPFRELFVELPRAVFESLQAVAEAAVVKARLPARRPIATSVPDRLISERAISYVITERYKIQLLSCRRSPIDHLTQIVAQMECGHSVRLDVYDNWLLTYHGVAGVIDVLDLAWRHAERKCSCVLRHTGIGD